MKLTLSVRKFLITLNVQLDALKDWCSENGANDCYSSLRCQQFEMGAPPQIVLDILLLEDRTFFRHKGFELRSIPRGFKRRICYGRFGGVSTIEQLLVRTYLQRRERTFRRKAREVLMAVLLNFHLTKDQILLAFINCAYFGYGLNGADTASIVISKKDAKMLNSEESAFVASLLPYPLPRNIAKILRENNSVTTPRNILETFQMANPWWTTKVDQRMTYLRGLRVRH